MSIPIIFKHRKYIQLIRNFLEKTKQYRVEKEIYMKEQLVLLQKEKDRLEFLNTSINEILYNEFVGNVENRINFSKLFTYKNNRYELRTASKYLTPIFKLYKIININRRSIDVEYIAYMQLVLEKCYDCDMTHDNIKQCMSDLHNIENDKSLQEKIYHAIMKYRNI